MSDDRKKLAALEKMLSEIEAYERQIHRAVTPVSWGRGATTFMEIFLSLTKRIGHQMNTEFHVKSMIAMRLTLWFFFDHLRNNPGSRRTLDPGSVLELVGVARRWAPKFKLLASHLMVNTHQQKVEQGSSREKRQLWPALKED